MISERLIGFIEQSIRQNWEIDALSNYREKEYTYKDIAGKILKLHILFRESGLKEGDKIALVGRNSANWCITYLATVTYGAVIVPVLPDFKPEDLINIINHSDSRILFVDDKIFESLELSKMAEITGVISLDSFGMISPVSPLFGESFEHLEEAYSKSYPSLSREDVKFSAVTNDALAVISYTSGTTGFSKGVMITHNSLACNVQLCTESHATPAGRSACFFPPACAYIRMCIRVPFSVYIRMPYHNTHKNPFATDPYPGIQ